MLPRSLQRFLAFLAISTAAGATSSVTSVILSVPPGGTVGQMLTFSVIVSPAATGTVAFYDGFSVLGIGKVNQGAARLTTSSLLAGKHTVYARYTGDAVFASALSLHATLTITGTFAAGFLPPVATADSVVPFAIADFNHDGHPDLVGISNSQFVILLGKGDGGFQANQTYPIPLGPTAVVTGDFNGDGNTDVAASGIGGPIIVFTGNGDGTFASPTQTAFGGTGKMLGGDFNQDGRLDLAITTSSGVAILPGKGDGTFGTPIATSFATQVTGPLDSFAAGDFNGDGIVDLMEADFTLKAVHVLIGKGEGSFVPAADIALDGAPTAAAVGDLNGDGFSDLVLSVGNNNGLTEGASVFLGNGDGSFLPYKLYGGDVPQAFAIADLNGDGLPDIVLAETLASQSFVGVLRGNGDGTFETETGFIVPALGAFFTVIPADLNGDGRTDVLVLSSQSNSITALLGSAPTPDLTISIVGDSLGVGELDLYHITVTNSGLASTTGTVTVTDTIPAGLALSLIQGDGWTCVASSVSCSRSDPLTAGASYPPIGLTVVPSSANFFAINTALVSGGGEINLANDSVQIYQDVVTAAQSQTWPAITPPAGLFAANAPGLLTDGSVMVHQGCTPNWYRLKPDNAGNYSTGIWSQPAAMPSGVRTAYGWSATLPDGRLFYSGWSSSACATGVLNFSPVVEPFFAAVYDPALDTWSQIVTPNGLPDFLTPPAAVLSTGKLLIGYDFNGPQLVQLDHISLTWQSLSGTGKADPYSGESWTLLPDGTIFTVDAGNGIHGERYSPAADTWTSAGDAPSPLAGPRILRADGTVLAAGKSGLTGIYTPSTGGWGAGPTLPSGSPANNAVASASLLPDGNMLLGLNETGYGVPSFYEFDGESVLSKAARLECSGQLLLPTAQVLCVNGDVTLYTNPGLPQTKWQPTLAVAPTGVAPGQIYKITGTQFNGLSQGTVTALPAGTATNFPLVRIVNDTTGHILYCRTHDFSTMGVATGSSAVTAQFDVPTGIESGPSKLYVVTNGIASSPWSLNVVTTGVVPVYVSDISPAAVYVGSDQLTITMNGNGFAGDSQVNWNGIALHTIVGSPYQLTAIIPSTLITELGVANISVSNASGLSNAIAFSVQPLPPPVISAGGVVPLYSTASVIQSGEWISIYGANFSAGAAQASGVFPASLRGASVTIDGNPASFLFVSPGLMNVLVPDDSTIGQVQVVVTTASGSATATVSLAAVAPSFLLLDSTHVAGIILRFDNSGSQGNGTYDVLGPTGNSLGYPTVAAQAGDIVELFAVGLGPTDPVVPSGQFPSVPAATVNPVTVTINGQAVTPSFAGLSGTGLYQINLTIPFGLGTGDVSLGASVSGAVTQQNVSLAIQ